MNKQDGTGTPGQPETSPDMTELDFDEEIDIVDEEEAVETAQIKAELKERERQGR